MAKSTTSKKDPQDPQAPERRRRSTNAAPNGADETVGQAARPRRKVAPRPAAGEGTVIGSPTAIEAAREVAVPHEDIAVRAYHIYLERGGGAGDDFEDWITAERELRERAAGQRVR